MIENIRFAPEENWHVTLSFLGYQNDDDISRITNALRETADKFAPRDAVLEKLIYGPPGRAPRMIWIAGSRKTGEALGEIKNHLENRLEEEGINFHREFRKFNVHITVARFAKDFRARGLPKIEKELGLTFSADSLVLMESELGRGGPKYTELQSFPLRGNS